MKKTIDPSFCVIAPTPYLEQFASLSNTHLTLAHLFDDGQYFDFYRKMSARGDFIMNDNSAFELGESFDPHCLIDIAKDIRADAQVLPDYPGVHHGKTVAAAEEWIPEYKAAGLKTFFVPQSSVGDMEGWIEAYTWAANNPDIDIIGMSILGIPNALPAIDRTYARVVMVQILRDRGLFANHKHHHFLGLNNGPRAEVNSLLRMNALTTMDSSNPVWMGILGHRYAANSDSYLTVSKVSKHVDFSYPMTKDATTLDNIKTNVAMTLALFK